MSSYDSTAPAPGVICRWNLSQISPEQIAEDARKLIADTKAKYDRIGALDDGEVSLESCIKV